MKYKVGDKVRVRSKGWYDMTKSRYGDIECGNYMFYQTMSHWCGEIITIAIDFDAFYRIKEDNGMFKWTDEMIECKVEDETKPLTYEETVEIIEAMQGIGDSWECPQGYQFVDENGNVINSQKIVLEKKKEYPKTYKECLAMTSYDKEERLLYLLDKFKQLLICRDVYWKIAGDKMGLGEPWKPDYDSGVNKYGIICMNGVVQKSNPTTNWERHLNKVLDFPTEEMRDAFNESFKELINECKELL